MHGAIENMAAPSMSVVIVNWNGEKWLPRCIDSFLNQSLADIEIVVVDNNSTDGSMAILRSYGSKIVVVQHSENAGFAKGNELGIAAASSERILIANTDIWVEPDYCQQLLDYKVRHNLDVVGPFEARYDGTVQPPYTSTIDIFGHQVYIHDNSPKKSNFFLTGVSLLFDKKLYQETGGLDVDFFMYVEEIDWFWRLNLMGYTFSYVPGVYVYHYGSGSTTQSVNPQRFQWRNQNALTMLLKNYHFSTLCIVVPLFILINVGEAVCFTLIGKVDVARSYLRSWRHVVRNMASIRGKRRHIQSRRRVSDMALFRRQYHGLGKLQNLFTVLKPNRG